MALLIERRSDFHVGYHCARSTDPAGTIRQLNVGWISVIHFRGSLSDLLQRWQRAADAAVREEARMWRTAETVGTDPEVV